MMNSKIQIHRVIVLAVDGVRTGDDALLEAAQIVAPCAVAAIRIELVRAADEFVRAALAGFDHIHVPIGPGDFAVAPQSLGVVERDRSFCFAKITRIQEEQCSGGCDEVLHF